VFEFYDDTAARGGVQRLRAAGVADGSMQVARAAVPAAPPSEAPVLSRVFWTGLWWSVAGGFAGAIVGLIVGLDGWGIPGTSANIGIQVAAWAMCLHVACALAGCYAALDTGDRFARKAEHHDTPRTVVRVRARYSAEVARIEQILTDAGGTPHEDESRGYTLVPGASRR
jgi:hypothetical protein